MVMDDDLRRHLRRWLLRWQWRRTVLGCGCGHFLPVCVRMAFVWVRGSELASIGVWWGTR